MSSEHRSSSEPRQPDEARCRELVRAVRRRAPLDAVPLLSREDETTVGRVLELLEPVLATRILACLPPERRERLSTVIGAGSAVPWEVNLGYGESTVGRLMEPPSLTFGPELTVLDTVRQLRPLAQERELIYLYVVDPAGRLQGVVAMRELLFAGPQDRLGEIMIEQPFFFVAETAVEEAMRQVLRRHYPLYPVCDAEGRLVGLVRGYVLFEQHSVELSAQVGRMVGVEKEEHLSTPWQRCLAMRHPWLQLNLLTAFLAGAVVGLFEDTIARAVTLAAFLPVLAGQSGNTGCQALAVTLRGLTLNELQPGMERRLVAKEALLGLSNGTLVGLTAGLAMLAYGLATGAQAPALLALIVFVAMVGSCVASGVAGTIVPLVLRRLGADPATASTIFLTTATDVVSIGSMLGLAALLLM